MLVGPTAHEQCSILLHNYYTTVVVDIYIQYVCCIIYKVAGNYKVKYKWYRTLKINMRCSVFVCGTLLQYRVNDCSQGSAVYLPN